MNYKSALILLIAAGEIFSAKAQNVYTLQQCIDYALANHEKIKNAELDYKMAKSDIKATTGIGLPQINVGSEFNHNYKVPVQLVPNFFGNDPELLEVSFGTSFNSNVGVSMSQIIFSGSYFVGLQAAKAYSELMQNAITKSKTDVIEAVSKAYYNVLITEERLKLVDANINQLDTLFKQTSELYKAGFVEKLDLDKITVSLNNLKTEKLKFGRFKELSYTLLKFQMAMPIDNEIKLAEQIQNMENISLSEGNANPENRAEFALLQQQKKLYELDRKNNMSGYLPSLVGVAAYSYSSQSNDFSNIYKSGYAFPAGFVGLKLDIPIFDGMQKNFKIQKSKLNIEKTDNDIELFKRAMNMEVVQANISIKSALSDLQIQKNNMEIAQKVYDSAVEKRKIGVGSMLEITSAQTELKTAQTNYYNALYEAVIAKINLDIATGNLK